MPWHVERGGGTCADDQYAVIKDDDGSTAGCHDTEEEAHDQLAALYASEGDKTLLALLDDKHLPGQHDQGDHGSGGGEEDDEEDESGGYDQGPGAQTEAGEAMQEAYQSGTNAVEVNADNVDDYDAVYVFPDGSATGYPVNSTTHHGAAAAAGAQAEIGGRNSGDVFQDESGAVRIVAEGRGLGSPEGNDSNLMIMMRGEPSSAQVETLSEMGDGRTTVYLDYWDRGSSGMDTYRSSDLQDPSKAEVAGAVRSLARDEKRAPSAPRGEHRAMAGKKRKSTETDPTTDPRFERKAVSVVGVKVLDEAQGIVEAVVSGIGNVDDGGDIVMPTFFESSLNTHLKKLPKGVWSHDWDMPIAKTLETYTLPPGDPRLPRGLKEVGAGGQYVKGQFNLRTQRGRDAFEDVKFFSESDEQEWSIGYVPIVTEPDENGNRQLKEGAWYEWSPVLFGMNPLTATVGVKNLAAIAGMTYERACKRLRELMDGDETKRAAVLDAIRDMAEDKSAGETDDVPGQEDKATPHDRPSVKQFAGSIEERMSSVYDAIQSWVKDNSPGGSVEDPEWGGYQAYGYPVATFDDHVIVCVIDYTLDGDDRRKHYDFPLSFSDGTATLGSPTEVVLEVVVSPKTIEAAVEVKRIGRELARKEGRRHSKADQDALQRIHDDAVALGASCEDDDEYEETEKGADVDAAEAAELASIREFLGLDPDEPAAEPTAAATAAQDEPEPVDPAALDELKSLASSLA